MGLGSCYSCIKYLMFAFNFLFWLLGCAILGVGIWLRVDPNFKQYVDSNDAFNYLYTGAYILIVVGVVIMVIGFLGCCGAIRESQCMLCTFFILLLIIFGALLSVGIWAIVKKDSLKGEVNRVLDVAVKNYDTDEGKKMFMDNIQTTFKCCGSTEGKSDYGRTKSDTCVEGTTFQPCNKELFNKFSEYMVVIAGVAIGIGVVMLMGMIFAMCLCCEIRKTTDQYQ